MKKSIATSLLLLVMSAGMLVGCNNKKEPSQTIISLEDGELVLSNEPTSDGLVYERDLDGEGFSIKDYVGNSTNVVIPKKFEGKPVKRIQSFAFQHKYLQVLTIPDTVEVIEDYAFIENDEFNTIKVSGKHFFLNKNALYRHVEGEKKQKTLVYVTPQLTGQFIVDENVVGITKGAFQSTGLTIVDLNADLVNTHFQNLFGLSAESIPDNMKQVCLTGGNVKDYAFTGVKAISSLVVYDPVETIGNKAFYNCQDLTTVLIPDSVTSIGEQAFANCANLKEIRIGNTNAPKLANLGNGAFDGCARLEGYVKLGIKYIGNPQCENLIALEAKNLLMESLSFEDDTKFICSEAFKNCVKLENLDLGKVVSIGDKAFYGCISLKNDVVLPNSLKSFGNRVFEGTSVKTGNKIDETATAYYLKTKDGERKALIGYKTNANNKLSIAADTEWVDTYAINGSTEAQLIQKFETASDNFEVSDDFTVLFDSKMKVIYGSAKGKEIDQDDVKFDSVVEIKPYGLSSATISGFEMPEKLKTIGDHAFYAFTGKNLNEFKFVLPETVVSVGDCGLADMSGFTELVLNDGLLVLGKEACANNSMTNALFFPSSLSYVGANVFAESLFSAIKVAAKSAPASWDPAWLGPYPAENVIYNAVR